MSNVSINDFTLAVITTNRNASFTGGCPVFYASDDDDMQEKAMLMAKCVDGVVHQIGKETLIVVKH
ncbi:MAG: capping complex subunit for YIEGIA [Intestinibacter sp.]|uniref:capping complex subunit for YIEGIA n=1 Tax=Intestinibacter sp. TaxID=1965304 RepID=UPI003F17AD83